ncbi:MAG: hypothetical protein IJO60_06190 [Agathobacter sp.]|nr:hypothetical protein [Agathobacter sp.]
MKEKLMMAKDKVVDFVKKVFTYFKTNMMATAVLGFSVVSLILILVSMLALNEFVVSVCVLIILEAGMAAFLHKAELWKHGIMLVAQFVAGLIIGRVPLVIICIIAYVTATVALQFMTKTSPKA